MFNYFNFGDFTTLLSMIETDFVQKADLIDTMITFPNLFRTKSTKENLDTGPN